MNILPINESAQSQSDFQAKATVVPPGFTGDNSLAVTQGSEKTASS